MILGPGHSLGLPLLFHKFYEALTTMAQHRYRVTLEHLADTQGESLPPGKSLQFEVENHDDIFSIVERLRGRGDFSEDTATAFGVGLKLFSEVMLKDRQNPLFQSFEPHFMQFMKALKQGTGKA